MNVNGKEEKADQPAQRRHPRHEGGQGLPAQDLSRRWVGPGQPEQGTTSAPRREANRQVIIRLEPPIELETLVAVAGRSCFATTALIMMTFGRSSSMKPARFGPSATTK